MRLRVPLSGMRSVLLGSGFGLLGYSGYVLADAWWFQREASAVFERATEPERPMAAPVSRPAIGKDVVGRLVIPRLGLSVMVLEGTSDRTLRRAAGHITGTALPGQPGNVAISAHRDTFFYPLRNIRRDDVLALTTAKGEFRYRVISMTVVRPDDMGVLAAGDTQALTLVTCYPFAFIGPAPERFIVRAERMPTAEPTSD